ncbi:hypothetical protein SEA_SONALI_27 [Arthrobacter phage Sonali]|uniref:Uncharacterized protein n=1 Tax=Arthrobacter phage Sonali TaxID=2510495 RepID=A0A411CQD2_9CAUD|nr:hypothetical protein HOV09_gp27 [Arthrobacter phage Sonali]QAY16139.1 hypothetical protein SEA_SONALI_27 [Arthrobacter phage Sonali]
MAMELGTVIVRKQAEANALADQITATQGQLDAKNEEIARLQDLYHQGSYSVQDIDYLLSVDAL